MNTGLRRAHPAHALDDPARQRADVRAAVAADLGLVAHAAQRDADELAPQRARDRLAERRLADAGRADEAEDRALLPRRELAHGQVLEDALLHLLEVVVIGVEDLARLIEVQPILGPLRPRQLHQPLEVGALDRVLGRRLRHLLEALELLARRLLDVGRHLRRLDLLVERVEVAGVFALAELVLDRLQLLAQDRLALVLRELLAHLQVDLLLDLDQLDLALQQHEQPPQPLRHVALHQQRGALLGRQVDRRGDDVAQPAGILVLVEHLRRLVRDVGRDGDELLGDVVHRHAQPVDLDRVLADLDQRLVGGDAGRASPA